MDQNFNAPVAKSVNQLATAEKRQQEFIDACLVANELQLADNVTSVFQAADIVGKLRAILSKEMVEHYFMPLMGTRVGFLTDRDKEDKNGKKPEPYGWETVRDCIIDAACMGLAPVKNQMNIISGSMYPTKEGFTALLKKIGVKYLITTSEDKSQPTSPVAQIECKVIYELPSEPGEKKNFTYTAFPKKNAFSSLDQLKGKAERKAKKALYELITGIDLGDADEESSAPDYQPQGGNERKEALRERIRHDAPVNPTLL